jgi:glycosyltransferase involved in cell wall biosynthesis
MINKNIIIVSHKFLTQPDDDFVFYLNRNKARNVLHIRHSFHDARDRLSFYTWYKSGKIFKEEKSRDFKSYPEPLIYLKEFYFTIKWTIISGIKWDQFIGMDGMCAFFGNTLRTLGNIKKTIFWAIDFVPENRFKGRFKNKIYNLINMHGYKNSDEMWDLGPRMFQARRDLLGIHKKDYKKHRVVPYGVWTERIKRMNYEKCNKYTIVFMGNLLEKQGAQLIIKAIPKLQKIFPSIKFKIIGEGAYKNLLIELAKKLHVDKRCEFMGKIEDHKILEEEIAKSAIAVAPYIKSLDTWTKYADPGKIKTYLACGVPLLLTDVSYNAKDIQSKKCGFIITEDINDIVSKITMLLKKDINEIYRKNALTYSQTFNYENIFKNLIT